MNELIGFIVDNAAVCVMSAAGLVVGAAMLADLVVGALRKWEPIEVDRGDIVDPEGGRR